MSRSNHLSRRQFLGRSVAASVAVPYLVPSGILAADGEPGPNDRIGIAGIGIKQYRGDYRLEVTATTLAGRCSRWQREATRIESRGDPLHISRARRAGDKSLNQLATDERTEIGVRENRIQRQVDTFLPRGIGGYPGA